MKKVIIVLLCLLITNIQGLRAENRTVVKVGGYDFPPFVEDINGQVSGISIDLLELINSFQEKYLFEFVLTSSKRRFDHFNTGKYDMMMFESIDWGWKERDVDATNVYLEGGSVYVTKAGPDKDQLYFDDFTGKSILLILGYHYGFTNYNTDADILKKRYNATMTSTHEGNILSIAQGRADITVVIKAYLKKYIHEHPAIKEKILVSHKYDLPNYYTTLIRKDSKPNVEYMNKLFADMENKGLLTEFWKRYGFK